LRIGSGSAFSNDMMLTTTFVAFLSFGPKK